MSMLFRQAVAVAAKDFRSELRTRYAINALAMFVVVTVGVIAFSLGVTPVKPPVSAALLWVAMFFAAVTGLGRSFVSEEERGTTLLLRLTLPPAPVYLGKLIINLVISLISAMLIALLYLTLLPSVTVAAPGSFALTVALIAIGFAAVLTIVAAIIARTASKGALYPVLSFPMVLPMLMLGVRLLESSISGSGSPGDTQTVGLLLLYTITLVVMSYVLFDFLWKE